MGNEEPVSTMGRERMIVLLGDSIFDNGSYVKEGESDVLGHLRQELKPYNQNAELLARDGAVTAEVINQMSDLDSHKPTHLVISCGGNDALQVRYGLSELMNMMVSPNLLGAIKTIGNLTNLLGSLLEIRSRFQVDYSNLLAAARRTELAVVVCTIYDKCPGVEEYERMLLSIFNDIIISQASSYAIPVIDLRAICNEPSDYSDVSPIEPSTHGAAKIAKRIAMVAMKHDFNLPHTVIYQDR